ncbi:leucyl aminopeptidase family protein [Lysinibacillus sp. NPDC097195]|uniref:leucyl aminopeptidase family protein n=1 Tax=Lysinibacillus sp. NPDC097195 TaxID=3364141 RepID=UPI0038284470
MEFHFGQQNNELVLVNPVLQSCAQQSLQIPKWMNDKHKCHWFRQETAQGAQDYLIVGLGDSATVTYESLREAAGEVARVARGCEQTDIQVTFDFLEAVNLKQEEAVSAFVEGWVLGAYQFQKYRKDKVEVQPHHIYFLLEETDALKEAVNLGLIRATSTNLTRDLCNTDPIDLNPNSFTEKIRQHFGEKELTVNIYNTDELRKLELNGLLAVGRGSQYSSYLAEITYCTDASKPHIVLIGKGMTYDCGGVSIKTGRNISDMRMDMGGAGAVFGAMDLIASKKLDVNVTALLPISENLVNDKAFLPGEVICFGNGLHVQVGNTDAEGRLILADALYYSERLKPDVIVDIATLTGSIGAALGLKYAGVFGDDAITTLMKELGSQNGDFIWPMPLIDQYEESLASDYADICNIGSDDLAGSITAALFLRKFVPKGIKWGHIDMAAPVQSPKTTGYHVRGASGYGVRLLADFIESYSKFEKGNEE